MNHTETNTVRQVKTNEVTQNSFYNLTTLDKTIGTILFEARKKTGLTQKELADLAKISKPYVGTIENMRPHPESGALPKPDRSKVIRLVKALNSRLPPDEYLNLDDLLTMYLYASEHSRKIIAKPILDALASADRLNEKDMELIAGIIETMDRQKAEK